MSLARSICVMFSFAAAWGIAATPAAAQERDAGSGPSIGLVGGLMQYDLSGAGTSPFGGVRVQLPLGRFLVAEPGFVYMSYHNQAGTAMDPTWKVWLPEVQLQAQLPTRTVRPYVGVGLGFSHEGTQDARYTEVTGSVAAGVRVPLTQGFTAGGELRVRAIDQFHGATADWGFSIARRIR